MSNIDERIVEMKFENHLFNKNVESSVGVLEKLKETLKFDGIDKNLSEINDTVNKIDFSKMASGITDTARAFSIKGTIIRTVIQDMTRSAEALIGKIASFGPGGLIGKFFGQAKSGGWKRATNIDQAKFQIEGLGFAWDDVANSIDRAVSGTAYGADSAAKAASQLLASGVAVGEAMDHALLGISGVAAMTNSSYDEIAPIFTTIAGQGKVMTMQLRQLESRGLNVAASLGKSTGVFAGKTEKEIRDLVQKGKVEFQDFADAMDEVFGEHAKDADKTFEGSLDNMKAAASRVGQKVMEPFRKQAIPVFRATKGFINDINTRLTKTGVFDAIGGALRSIRLVLETIIGLAKNNLGFIDFIGDGVKFVANHIALGALHLRNFLKGFEGVKESANAALAPVEKVVKTLIDVDEIAHRVINGEFGNGEVRFKALDELTGIEGSWKTIQNRVNELLDSPKRYADAVDLSTAATEANTEANYDAVSSYDKLSDFGVAATKAQEAFGEALVSSVGEAENLSILDWAANVFVGLKSAVSVVSNTIVAFVKGAAVPLVNIGKTIVGVFGHVTGTIAKWLTNLNTWMHNAGIFEKIQNGINSAFTFMADILSSVGDGAKFVFDTIAGSFDKLGNLLGQGIDRIKEFWNALKESEGLKKIKGTFESIQSSIIDLKNKAFGKVKGWVDTFLGTDFKLPQVDISSFTSSVSEKLSWLSDKIEALRTRIHDFLYGTEGEDGNIGFLTKVGDKVEAIKTRLKTFGGTIHDFLFGKQEKDPKSPTGFKTQEGFLSKIVDRVVEIKNKLKTFGGTIHDWLFGTEDTDGILSKVGDKLISIKETLSSWGGSIHDFLFGTETTRDQEGKIGFLTTVSEKLKSIKERLKSFGGTIHDFLFGTEATDDQEATEGFLSKAYDKIQSIKETLKTFGGTVHDWLFGTEATADQEATEGFLSKVYDKLLEIKDGLKTFGGTVYDFLFGKKATGDQEATEGFLSKVYDKIVAIKDTLKSFGGTVVDWVADLFRVGESEEVVAEGATNAADAQGESNKTLMKLKSIAKAVGSAVSNAFKKAVDWIVKTKDNVIEFWDKFKQTEGYQKLVETFDKVKTKLLELKDKAIDKIKEAWEKFTGKGFKMPEFDIGSVANFVSDKIQWLIEKANALKEKIFGFFGSSEGEESGFSGLFGKLKEIFGDVDLSQGMESFTEAIGKARDTIVDFFKKLTESSEEAEGTETLLDKFIGFFSPIVTGVIEFVTKIVEFLGKFISFSVNFASENPVGAIMTVFGTFVGIKSAQLLAGIMKFIGTVGGGFADFAKGFKKNAKASAFKDRAEGIKNVAIAIGILAASMWVLAQVPGDKIGQVIGLIAAITIAVAALMWVASKTIMKGGEGTTVLNPLQSLGKSIADFGENLMKSMNKFGIAAMIISFALSVKILIGAIKSLGEMDRGTLLQGGIAVIGLMTALATAVTIMSKVGKKKGNLGKAAMILVFAIAIKKVAKVIKDLGKLNEKQLTQGLGAVTVIGLIFAGIIAVTKLMPSGAAALGSIGVLITIAGVFWVMAESVTKLASLPAENLNNAANALKKLILSVTLMIAAVDLAKGLKDVKATTLLTALAGVAFIVAEVGAELWLLSELPDEQIAKFDPISTALSRIYWSVAGVIAAVALFEGFKNSHGLMSIGEQAKNGAVDIAKTWGIGKTILIIAGIAAVVLALGEANKLLKEAGGSDVLQGIADALNEWDAPLTAIGNAVGRLIGGLVGGVVGGAWEAITGEDLGDTIKGWIGSIENLPEMLSTWFTSLNEVTSDMKSQMNSGELDKNISAVEEFKKYLDNYVDVANNILAICEAFHAMTKDYNAKYEDAVDMNTGYQDVSIDEKSLSGLFESWANALGTFSSTLVDRGFNAASTQDTITSAKDVLSSFGTLLGEVVKVDDLDDVTDTINSMPGFADALVGYSWRILLLNKGAVESTKSAAEIILALTDEAIGLGKENHIDDGLLGWAHANGTYLSEYANDLEPFAKGLVRYSEVIQDMRRTRGAVQSTKNAVKIINALAGEAIDTGTKNIITSESGDGLSYITVLSNYSGELEGFATGMVAYSNVISGMNVFSVAWTKKAVQVVNSLASAAPNMDYSKGIFGWITGNTLEDLKTALPAFAEGLVGFSRVIKGDGSADSGFATSTINDARESIEGLIETLYAIQTMNTMGWKNGEFLDTDQFRTNLGTITQRLQDFHRELTSGDAKTAIESIETAMHALGTGVGSALWEGLEEGFGGDTKNPYIGELLEVSDKIIDLMSLTFNKGVKESQKGSDTNMFQDIVGEQASGLPDFIAENPDIVGAGETTVTTMATAITSMTSTITTAVGTVCASAVNKAITYYSKWNNVGRNFDLHWAAGIRNNKSLVLDAVKAVTDDAIEVVNTMIDTIDNNVNNAVEGAEEVVGADKRLNSASSNLDTFNSKVDDTMSNITSALAAAYLYINQVVQQAMDSTPTITPVLDLSQLQNGMGYMNSMIGQNQFLNSNLHYAMSAFPGSYSYGNTQMSYDNSSMIDALNGVREDIKTLGEEMSNMKMVLDSGALVGSIGTGVDQKLGNIQKFKERWA